MKTIQNSAFANHLIGLTRNQCPLLKRSTLDVLAISGSRVVGPEAEVNAAWKVYEFLASRDESSFSSRSIVSGS